MIVTIMSACRDGEELDSQGDASSQPDTISIASRTSQNTLDSDKVGTHTRTISRHSSSPKCTWQHFRDTLNCLFYILISLHMSHYSVHTVSMLRLCHWKSM